MKKISIWKFLNTLITFRIRNKKMLICCVYLLLTLVTFGQKDSIIFIGDFNNGIIAKENTPNAWQKTGPSKSRPNDYRWELDSEIVRQGKYALRCELRPGDSCCGLKSERAEVIGMNDSLGNDFFINEKSGIQYFAFSVRISPDWQSPFDPSDPHERHSLFLQLHKKLDDGDPNAPTGPAISFQVFNRFFIRVNSGNIFNSVRADYELLKGDLNRGSWNDFIMKIKFAPDTSGEIIVWRRNEKNPNFSLVLNIKTPTLLYDSSSEGIKVINHLWHAGYYRAGGSKLTNVLWLDGFTIAKTAKAAQENAFNKVVSLPGDVPNAPQAIVATHVKEAQFNARWKTVENSSKYRIDVSLSPQFSKFTSTLISQGFNNGITPPPGWKFSNSGLSPATTHFGQSSPSIRFKSSNKSITTEEYSSSVKSLSFWLKAASYNAGLFILEGFDKYTWQTIDTIANFKVQGEIKTYDSAFFATFKKEFIQFRFTYIKNTADIYFDDVNITYLSTAPSFIPGYKNLRVNDSFVVVKGLNPNTNYYYRVRAENFHGSSPSSNVIEVTTANASKTIQNNSFIPDLVYKINCDTITATENMIVNVFPNPAINNFNLMVKAIKNVPISIVVADVYGKNLYQISGSTNEKYVFGNSFVPGIYFVQIIQNNIKKTFKLIKVTP